MNTKAKSYLIAKRDNQIFQYYGELEKYSTLKDFEENQATRRTYFIMNPFHSIREKGYEAHGAEEFFAFKIYAAAQYAPKTAEERIEHSQFVANISDEVFQNKVASIQKNEIAEGNASQVVLSRYFTSEIRNFSDEIAHSLFARSIERSKAYMHFLFFTGEEYFIGASPECHLNIEGGMVTMNPIAGTIKKDAKHPKDKIESFITDTKEQNELFQVLDEELKIMAKICNKGGEVSGPFLNDAGPVIHTEYKLTGEACKGALESFRESLHAPTLVGSPMQSAAGIIAKYEGESRKYYGAQCGFIGPKGIDTAITIRTMHISKDGMCRVQAGAGIVKESTPESESRETIAKAESMIRLFSPEEQKEREEISFSEFTEKLSERNKHTSAFHFQRQERSTLSKERLIQLANCQDDFIYMIEHMLKHMGYHTEVEKAEGLQIKEGSILLLGPGPGNPLNTDSIRIKAAHTLAKQCLQTKHPIMGICLGHQIICNQLGAAIHKLNDCKQGMQKEIIVRGKSEKLGLYNSFIATGDIGNIISRNGEVIMQVSMPQIETMQFHPESILSKNGYEILEAAIGRL